MRPELSSPQLRPSDIVAAGLCIGCGACVAQAAGAAAEMRWDPYGQLKPHGGAPPDTISEAFDRTCPFAPGALDEDQLARARFAAAPHHDARLGFYRSAFVGHVEEGAYRARGSSGGLVSWVAAELLKRGMVDGVAHVVAADPQTENRFFQYRISRSVDEVAAGARSRYYPVEMSSVLETIRKTPGRYAVVGIPCFIKAVNLLRAEEDVFRERIVFTLGLFCGHMKSARFLESLAWQMQTDISSVVRAEHRIKDSERPANWYTAELELGGGQIRRADWWHLADGDWGSGFFQNLACDFCDDVVAETADISFGDAWVEPYSSDGRGTNVVVVRSAELDRVLREAISEKRLCLSEVDEDFVADTQAAGFRQRREGLAYRLTWLMPPFPIRKRVQPALPPVIRRRFIYRMRHGISVWSHRTFRLARLVRRPLLYLVWARAALRVYHGLAYSRGYSGRLFDRVLGPRRGSG